MRRLSLAILLAASFAPAADPLPWPKFRMQEVERGLKVGYAIAICDVNGDGKPDIVVVDSRRVVWYENPTWQRRTILEGNVPADNVCIAPCDIDGDGKIDFFLGAGWKPFDTQQGGTLHWLRRGPTLDEPWQLHNISSEPTLHRIRVADLDGSSKPQLIVAPLMGRGSSKAGNWLDGRPVRLQRYRIPADPVAGPWVAETVDESLHVVHNIAPDRDEEGPLLWAASYAGVHRIRPLGINAFKVERFAAGDQSTPKESRGSSEVKPVRGPQRFGLATVEPWHGNSIVYYDLNHRAYNGLAKREVIDSRVRWGHAIASADLDGDGGDEILAGVRDNPAKGDTGADPRGVRIYRWRGGAWERLLVDPDGVAVEDLAVADLNGDGRPDIIAAGRATGNVRIYWNEKP